MLAIETKFRKMKEGVPQARLAEQYGVGHSMITDLKKNEHKIQEFSATLENQGIASKNRKIMRLAKEEDLEKALFMWFTQRRGQGTPVIVGHCWHKKRSNFMICSMREALLLYHSLLVLGRCGDSASVMELDSFSLEGEQLSANDSDVEPFKKLVQELMEENQLTLETIYNCDETGLQYKMLPDKQKMKLRQGI